MSSFCKNSRIQAQTKSLQVSLQQTLVTKQKHVDHSFPLMTKQLDRGNYGSWKLSTASMLLLPSSGSYEHHPATDPSCLHTHSYVWTWNKGLIIPLLAWRTTHVTRWWWLWLLWHRCNVGILGNKTSQLVWSLITSQGALHPKIVLLEL